VTPRRRLLAALSAGAAVVALTGCEKPAPIVTVVSGTTSEWKEADVYCFEGQSLAEDECVQRGDGPVRLEVSPGDRVGVDVDAEVVDRGWYIQLSDPAGAGQAQQSDVMADTHYFGFTTPNLGENGLVLTIVALGEQGAQGPPSGEWTFQLVPE
jgi:hypothetical protein